MAAAADFRASSNGEGRHDNDIPSSVLLSLWCPTATCSNAAAATSTASIGVPISVTFRAAARPPAVSHLSVDCPGLELNRADRSLAPKVLGTDADLALLRVPISPLARYDARFSDYFVYRVHPQLPKLDRLPSPPDLDSFALGDAILSCGGDGKYALAALQPLAGDAFSLFLYRSGSDGKAGRWTSQRVVVENPLRDAVCPVDPDSAQRIILHLTSKAIVLGGARGTVGWVDLWRGILLCDVLEESPKLRDMPLPLPSMANWSEFLDGCVCPLLGQCSVRSEDIDPPADIRMHFRLLHRFHRDKKEGMAAGIERTVALGCLHMAYPTLSIADDDDIVYLLCEGINAGTMKMVFVVDVRTRTLRGMVKHDAKRRVPFCALLLCQ